MKKVKRVVSIGAHSLDAELLGGPLIIKYVKEGVHCTFIHVTQGRLEDPSATESDKEEYLEKLLKENQEVASHMGADCLWLGYRSNQMPTFNDFAERLVNYFESENVDLVITHWRGSMHQRHMNTHDAVTEAVKRMRKKGNPIKLVYGECFEDLVGFIPQAYFILSESERKIWWESLCKYTIFRGEISDFPYQSYYNTIGQVRQIEADSSGFTKAYMYASLIEDEIW